MVGKDGNFLTSTLQRPRTSGYLVCSRATDKATRHNHESLGTEKNKIFPIPEITRGESASADSESGIVRSEAVISSGPRISSIRKNFEVFPQTKADWKVKPVE